MNKQDKKELRQQIACEWLEQNYLQYDSLRHDIVTDRLQIRVADLHSLEDASLQNAPEGLQFRGKENWRNLTDKDINTMVCQCVQETGVNISVTEIWTALKSDRVPAVHPIRAWLNGLKPYTDDQPDWIDLVASQVRVTDNDNKGGKINDNRDNLRPNQLPGALTSTPYTTLHNTTTSGEDNNTIPSYTSLDYPTSSSDRFWRDRPYGADRPINLTGEADLTVNEVNGLTSGSEQSERSKADRLWRACFKKWFVAMVASWMRDEVVNHQVLVLIGKQGIFKTTWLEHLIPPHLRAYACKLANSNDLNKDERLRIAEFGLISLDEIDSMNNRELNQLKSIITATDVNERAAYAYTKERRVRLASFCASGNRRDFLTDITGNRRWLPFEVESIQNPFFTTLPYNLMYAQAWALAQDPQFCYWFELDEIEVLEQHNQYFRDESNEEQLLDVYFAVPPTDATTAKFLTTAEISERLIYYGNIKKPMTLSRLGVLLSQKGFLSIRKGTPQRRGWIVYERDSEEINAERRMLSKN